MRELVDEEGAGIEKLLPVEFFPAVRRGPGRVGFFRERKSGRTEAENQQKERLVVPRPAIPQKAALRFPAHRGSRSAIQRPRPVRPQVELLGKAPDLHLGLRITVEIRGGRESPSEKEGAVDRGELAVPGATSGSHVEEVVIETPITRRIALFTLRAVPEELQGRKGDPASLLPCREAPFHRDRIGRQGKTHGGNARRGSLDRGVRDQTARGIGLVREVAEALSLQPLEELLRRVGAGRRLLLPRHVSPPRRARGMLAGRSTCERACRAPGACRSRRGIAATAPCTASASVGWI